MNQTHVHLLITHLPIFGSFLGALVLLHGLYSKSNATITAAYNVFILAAIGAGIAYFTGEAAEESVEHLQGISKRLIHEHEEAALVSLIGLIVLGVAALVGLFLNISKAPLSGAFSKVALVLAILSFVLIARTGYMGGQIRHSEVSSNTIEAAPLQDAQEEHED